MVVAFSPVDPNVAWANSYDFAVKSTDGGATWFAATKPVPGMSVTAAIGLSPFASGEVLLGLSGKGIAKSHDGGRPGR